MKEEFGCPGVCVAVSVNGETVWREGFGFADIENRVLCSSKTVMRIASISKPLTATAAGLFYYFYHILFIFLLGRGCFFSAEQKTFCASIFLFYFGSENILLTCYLCWSRHFHILGD